MEQHAAANEQQQNEKKTHIKTNTAEAKVHWNHIDDTMCDVRERCGAGRVDRIQYYGDHISYSERQVFIYYKF